MGDDFIKANSDDIKTEKSVYVSGKDTYYVECFFGEKPVEEIIKKIVLSHPNPIGGPDQ